VSKRLAGTGWL